MYSSNPLFSVASQPFKRSQLGLFQGKTKQYGNNVPFSKHKTRRTWLPNVQHKRLFSEILGEVRLKVTTQALRTIKKHKSLDNYLENTRADTLGWQGLRLRLKVREQKEKAGGADASPRTKCLDELEAIAARKLNIKAAEEQRDVVMKALNLRSRPTARQTVAFLEAQKRNPDFNLPTSV